MNSDNTPFYEYIVVGCGGVGSGALYWLSKKAGNKVLGLEQFKLGHDHGGSQDHSRGLRHTYLDKMYTKLTPETYKAWQEVEEESGTKLTYITGSLVILKNNTPAINLLDQYTTAMDAGNIPYEILKGPELRKRYPQWTVSDDTTVIYQPGGGLVDAALGNSVHVQLAQAHGATVIEECTVKKLEPLPNDQCLVHSTKGTFRCRRVIVTSGAWINNVLSSVGVKIPVTVTQEQVSYYAAPNVKSITKQNFPAFMYHTTPGYDIYGLPSHVNSYLKIGIDSAGPSVTPETRTYTPDPDREEVSMNFIKSFLPKSVGELVYTKTCLYTMTLDRDFVVDTLASRGMPQIVVCCGAGHAYKFASFLGKILSEMAVYGETKYDISGFKFTREAVQNPNTKAVFWRGTMDKQAKL